MGRVEGVEGAHVRRPALLDKLLSQPVAWLVAPSGYGKTRLLDELVSSAGLTTVFVEPGGAAEPVGSFLSAVDLAFRRGGFESFAEALRPLSLDPSAAGIDAFLRELGRHLAERTDPVAIIVDEVDRVLDRAAADGVGGPATTNAEALISGLARTVRRPHRLIVAGHHRPPEAIRPAPGAALLEARDLAFTAAETIALGEQLGRSIDDGLAAELVRDTGGWPAAIALALQSDTIERAELRRGITPLVDAVLAELDPADRATAAALAELPLLSRTLAEAIAGSVALDRIVEIGIVSTTRPDGWATMAEPVREVLATRGGLRPDQSAAAARAYLDAGQPSAAVTLLLRRGETETLADLLAGRSWRDLQGLGIPELRALVAIIPATVVDARPRLLLALARVGEAAVELEWRAELLARASGAAGEVGPDLLVAAVLAEQASDAAVQGSIDDALELADRAIAAIPATVDPPDAAAARLARARARWAQGRALAFGRTPAGLARASEHLREAAFLLGTTGEPELRAQALTTLGYGIHFAEGELDEAASTLREAADIPSSNARQRAATLTFLADALLYLGELDEAAALLREVGDTARRLHDQRLLGYRAWMEAGVASRRGDADAVAWWLAEAERHPGDWFEHPTGIEFLADAVDHLGRVGRSDAAAAYLARVEARCAADTRPGIDQIALAARAIHGARFGDPAAAERDLEALLGTEQLPRREAWRVALLRAAAALRAGDGRAAAGHAERARQALEALGHPELPLVHEPIAARALAPEAAVPPRVTLLGGFIVAAPGRVLRPPPGRPAALVKLLAVRGPVAVDEAIELLWPEVDEATGRARLRNVLSRLRSSCGELVARDDGSLRLATGVIVDAGEFERAAREALAAPPGDGDERAAHALARYAGELLPGDRYEDFTAGPRERLAALQLALIDRLAAAAAARGDVDEALRRFDEALATAPLDEHRYEAAARLALGHGRRQRAAGYLARARSALADLDLPLSDELAELERRLAPVAAA